MKIYNYHPTNFEFTGAVEARNDPLDSSKFLLPAQSTTIKPSDAHDNCVQKWDKEANAWESIEDHRGNKAYSDNAVIDIVEIGKIPSGFSLEQPIPSLIADKLQELDNYHQNNEAIKVLMINNILSFSLKKDYRRLLKDEIDHLAVQIEDNEIKIESANFLYNNAKSNISALINIVELKKLYSRVRAISAHNYNTKQEHISNITSLTSKEAINSYDFNENYLINQNIDVLIN